MFAYCGNNPVRRIDITGDWWLEDAWDWMCGAAEDAWDWTCGAAEDAWDWTCGATEDAWDWTCDAAKNAWDFIKEPFETREKAAETFDDLSYFATLMVLK